MELLRPNKNASSTGKATRIYEFRGRHQKVVETTGEDGQAIKLIEKGQQKHIFVVADNLYEAVAFLQARRQTFVPDKVMYLQELQINKSF